MNVIIVDRNKHESFLADHRQDPYTRQLIGVGDKIVICANCKTVYLESSWKIKGHCSINPKICESVNTLSSIPNQKAITHFSSKPTIKIVEKKTINKTAIALFVTIIIILLAIILFFSPKYFSYRKSADELIVVKQDVVSYENNIKELTQSNNKLATENNILKTNITTLEVKNKAFEEEVKNLKTINKGILSKHLMSIYSIEFKSTNYSSSTTYISYGNTLYSSLIYYLCPKISYNGAFEGNIKLSIKIIQPNGVLVTGNSSPSGYTYEQNMYCKKGYNTAELGGWGNSSGGTYSSGNYRIEFWYSNVCIGEKNFYIY